uniref:FtsX-like permease family protein n=1 Tax=Lentzea alba TaxID=2714351 RepID=UPI0039BF6C7B
MINDLTLGVRLTVGGSRKSWVRLALQGIGIGLCVAVLLLAASLPTAIGERNSRGDASEPVSDGTGPPPLLVEAAHPQFGADTLRGRYVRVLAPDAPVPPGIDRLPGDGEIFLSPALAELLASPEGELLRPRFPQKVVGTIGQEGLQGPIDLLFFAGDKTIEPSEGGGGNATYRFGMNYGGGGVAPILWLLSVVGVIVLLFPVLVFVGVSARLAAAQRDRRLAALRLVGAGANRVRLIASGEALAGAFVGLAAGFGLFYLIRPLAAEISIEQLAVFPSDLTPSLGLTLAVVIIVPVLAVCTSLFAMRRTIIEPLGVVREQKPVRRRVWWRLVPTIAGAALLGSQMGKLNETDRPDQWPVVLGVVFLMFGIPVLLPWLVERVVFRIKGGSPALQLAVRRLQLDSGTAARVVGGVAVVLAGTVTLQMILAGVENEVVVEQTRKVDNHVLAVTVSNSAEGLREALAKGRGVREVHELVRTHGNTAGERPNQSWVAIAIGTCAALQSQITATNCTDGKAYIAPGVDGGADVTGGTELTFGSPGPEQTRWRLPAVLEQTNASRGGVYLTPAAAAGLDHGDDFREYQAVLDPAVPSAAEHARNAIAPYSWRTSSYYLGQSQLPEVERVFGLIRQGLYAGTAITLLLAGASMLLVALEQVRERRRPLAVMAASGVPRGTLARSLLWQNGLPLVLSTVVSVGTGIGLGALAIKVSNAEVAFDWPGIALITGASMALVLAVTALTLPSLRRATGALGLRTE